MPLSSKLFTEFNGEKNCENWLIFSEDMVKAQYLTFFWATLCRA